MTVSKNVYRPYTLAQPKFELTEANFRRMRDFIPGLSFVDVMPLFNNKDDFKGTIDLMASKIREAFPDGIDYVAGIELLGVPFASALAYVLGVGNIMVRKKGKLPGPTHSYRYQNEYALDQLEIQKDAIKPGEKVIVIDDLLATGETLKAVYNLFQLAEAKVVAFATVIETPASGGRDNLAKSLPHVKMISLVNLTYHGDKPVYDPADYEKEKGYFEEFIRSHWKEGHDSINDKKENVAQ